MRLKIEFFGGEVCLHMAEPPLVLHFFAPPVADNDDILGCLTDYLSERLCGYFC